MKVHEVYVRAGSMKLQINMCAMTKGHELTLLACLSGVDNM